MKSLREFLRTIQIEMSNYDEVCREERQLCFLLGHLILSHPEQLSIFSRKVWPKRTLPDQWLQQPDAGVYVEYALFRDYWNKKLDAPKREAFIYEYLGLSSEEWTEIKNRKDLDKPCSPAHWKTHDLDRCFTDNHMFLRACKLRWAFHAKPDIVILLPGQLVLSIEAKYESRMDQYGDKRLFDKRSLDQVDQVSYQRYLFESILGFNEYDVGQILLQRKQESVEGCKTMSWREAFEPFKHFPKPPYMDKLIDNL